MQLYKKKKKNKKKQEEKKQETRRLAIIKYDFILKVLMYWPQILALSKLPQFFEDSV